MAITTIYGYDLTYYGNQHSGSTHADLAATSTGFLLGRDTTGTNSGSLDVHTSTGGGSVSYSLGIDLPAIASWTSSKLIAFGTVNGNISGRMVDQNSPSFIYFIASPGAGSNPDVAVGRPTLFTPATNPDFYVAYENADDIRLAIYNGDRTLRTNLQVTSTSADEGNVHIAVMAPEILFPARSGGIAMTFDRYTPAGATDDLMIAVYNADGSLRKTQFLLTSDVVRGSADITDYNTGFAVTWVDKDGDVRLSTFDRDGAQLLSVTARSNATNETLLNPNIDVLPNGDIAMSIERKSLSPLGFSVTSKVMMILDPVKVGFLTGPGVKYNQVVSVGGTYSNSDLVATADGHVVVAGTLTNYLTDTTGTGVFEAYRTTTGDEAANILTGDALKDNIIGNGGSDSIDGKGGADIMSGGTGNDIYYVDNIGDRVSEASGAGTDSVYSTVSFSLAGQFAEHVFLQGSANANATGNDLSNRLVGNNAANVLTGGAGSDALTGNGGNDILIGGTDHDVLSGGAGADIFRFNAAPLAANSKTISDFVVADDTIQLENAVMTALGATTGVLAPAKFVANIAGVATLATHRIVYDINDGKLYYDPDGNGAAAQVLLATMSKNLPLTSADFVVI